MARILASLLCAIWAACVTLSMPVVRAADGMAAPEVTGCYVPVPGGWRLHLTTGSATAQPEEGTVIGVHKL